jgi:hypothetical protein
MVDDRKDKGVQRYLRALFLVSRASNLSIETVLPLAQPAMLIGTTAHPTATISSRQVTPRACKYSSSV